MFCHKCGHKSPEGSAFCQKCGTKVMGTEPAPSGEKLPVTVDKGTTNPSTLKSVETIAETVKVDTGRNEITIHGYTGDYINMKIKVFRNGKLVGTIDKGGELTIPNDTDAVFLFKCAFRKSQHTVKAGSGELQLVWNKQSGQLNVFDLNDPNLGEEQEKLAKSEKKWLKGIAILVGVVALVALFAFFMSDGVNHQEVVRYANPFEDVGITATYEKVIDKYFTSPKWNERRGNGDVWYVDVSGKIAINGSETNSITLTFEVTPQGNRYLSDTFWIKPYSIDIDGESHGAERASSFIAELFDAYEQGYESMDNYYGLATSTVPVPSLPAGNNDIPIAPDMSGGSGIGAVDANPDGELYDLNDIVDMFGSRAIYLREEFGDYEAKGLMFQIDLGLDMVFGFEGANLSSLVFDGVTLDKNRAGLIAIFGEPTYETQGEFYYMMEFARDGYAYTFYLDSPNDIPVKIGIWESSKDTYPSSYDILDYVVEVIGSWRISEGGDAHGILEIGRDIEFFADGSGKHSLNGRNIMDFTWNAVIVLEMNYNADVPFEEEVLLLIINYGNNTETPYYLYDYGATILSDSQLVLGNAGGPPLILSRQ